MERNRPRIRPRIHEWMTLDSCIREKFVDGLWARLASHKGMISLREPHKGVILQSQTGEELDALSSSPSVASGIPSAEGATIGRGVQGRVVIIMSLPL